MERSQLVAALVELAEEENLLLGSIEELIAYQRERTSAPEPPHRMLAALPLSAARLPTPLGVFDIYVFKNSRDEELVVVAAGDLQRAGREGQSVLTRIHSACFTGDVLGSLRCDCGGQLSMAMARVAEEVPAQQSLFEG